VGQQKNSFSWRGIAVLAVLAAVVAGFALFGSDGATGDTLERAREGAVVRIGFANEDPYGYRDTDTGRVTGEAPEIARVILKRMGIENLEPKVAKFGELIPGLKAGQLDIVAAGMYITPERCREIEFSNPTYRIGESFIVRKGNPKDLHSFEDVAAGDARIGVMGGAVEHGYAKKLGVPEERIRVYEDYETALVGLKGERIDALAATALTVTVLLRKHDDPEIERAEPFTDPVIDGKPVAGYGAFGFRKEDVALREEFDRHLAEFLGTPEHLALVEPFGFGRHTLPGDVTAEQLCGGSD